MNRIKCFILVLAGLGRGRCRGIKAWVLEAGEDKWDYYVENCVLWVGVWPFWFCCSCLCEFSILCSFFLWIYVLSCPLLSVLSEAATKARLKEEWLNFLLATKFAWWLVIWGLEFSLYLLYIDIYWKQLNEREKIHLSGKWVLSSFFVWWWFLLVM